MTNIVIHVTGDCEFNVRASRNTRIPYVAFDLGSNDTSIVMDANQACKLAREISIALEINGLSGVAE